MSTATASTPNATPNGAPIPRKRPPPMPKGMFIPKKHAKPPETLMNSIVGRRPETPPTLITREPTPDLSDFEGGPDEVVEFPLIVGNFEQQGVTWNVMKFHNVPRGQQIMNSFTQPPVMLNRKDPKYNDHDPDMDISEILAGGLPVPPGSEESKLVPLKGQDGQIVYGPDGKPVMVSPDTVQPRGRGPVILPGAPPPPKKKLDEKKKPRKNAKKFRQIFTIPEEQRKLRKEERFPWVMEDQSGTNAWVGRMQDEKPKQLLSVNRQGFFEWYPCYRTYMFNKIPHWRVFNGDEANAEYEKMQKSKDPAAFVDSSLMSKMSTSTQSSFRKLAAGSGSGSRGGPSAPMGLLAPEQRLVRVIAGQKHDFFKDDDETVIKREPDLFGEDPGEDEHPFEDDVQDDDEGLAEELMDEEDREREERLKKEYRQANKEDYEFDVDDPRLSKAGKATRKLLKAHDKSGIYTDSDSDKNPYLSSEDEEEEEEVPPVPEKPKEEKEPEKEEDVKPPKEVEKTPTKETKDVKVSATSAKKSGSKSGSRSGTPTGKASPGGSRSGSPAVNGSTSATKSGGSKAANASRAMSPTPARGAGNALVAMRATSPPHIVHKPKIPSRGVSPPMSNAPSPSGSNPKKRKADDPSSTEHSSKKLKTSSGRASTPSTSSTPAPASSTSSPMGPFPGMLTRDMVIKYLRQVRNPATKDAIAHFKHMWIGGPQSDQRNRVLLTTWIKEVATINEKKELLLKPEFAK